MDRRIPSVTRISDAIAAELENRILEGALKPGDRLAGERELSVELGVSRPSLREAIRKLVTKGLLHTRHGGGTFVTDHLNAHFVDPWQEMLKGHPDLQSDLLELRFMLEGGAAALAAERSTDVDIERLDAAYADLSAAFDSGDVSASVEVDVAFHQAIAEASHNVLIGHLQSSLMKVIHDYVERNLAHLQQRPKHWLKLKEQHAAIWNAVRARNPEAAARAARAHVEFVRRTIVENAQEDERRYSALLRMG